MYKYTDRSWCIDKQIYHRCIHTQIGHRCINTQINHKCINTYNYFNDLKCCRIFPGLLGSADWYPLLPERCKANPFNLNITGSYHRDVGSHNTFFTNVLVMEMWGHRIHFVQMYLSWRCGVTECILYKCIYQRDVGWGHRLHSIHMYSTYDITSTNCTSVLYLGYRRVYNVCTNIHTSVHKGLIGSDPLI